MSETRAYYAIIPANVRYDKRIPANAKLLYGEITALCGVEGFCWARNSYFEALYDVSDKTVRRWINALEEAGYITVNVEYEEDGKTVIRRCISISATNVANVPTPGQKCPYPPDKNVPTPGDKNVRLYNENNTDRILQENNRESIARPLGTMEKPRREDIIAYCDKSGYYIDVDIFIGYYESNGWKVGKNPMKDWKAAVRSWWARDRRDKSYDAQKGTLSHNYTPEQLQSYFNDLHDFDNLDQWDV